MNILPHNLSPLDLLPIHLNPHPHVKLIKFMDNRRSRTRWARHNNPAIVLQATTKSLTYARLPMGAYIVQVPAYRIMGPWVQTR